MKKRSSTVGEACEKQKKEAATGGSEWRSVTLPFPGSVPFKLLIQLTFGERQHLHSVTFMSLCGTSQSLSYRRTLSIHAIVRLTRGQIRGLIWSVQSAFSKSWNTTNNCCAAPMTLVLNFTYQQEFWLLPNFFADYTKCLPTTSSILRFQTPFSSPLLLRAHDSFLYCSTV